MKKIALYINSLRFGGAERVMCNLATNLSENGYEVILITSISSEKEYDCGKNVRRICLNTSRIENFIKRNLYLITRLRRTLKAEKPNLLISFMAEPNYRSLLASTGLKNKVIVSIRNDPNKEYPSILSRFLAKNLFRFADGVVFQTEDAKNWFPFVIAKKSEIIFNQVDESFYSTKFIGERHGVVSTGRLTAQKNQKMLIKAFASVADRITDNLIIYGEGELRSELESLITELHMTERVFLPGSINNVSETIASAKLFILTSDYEGLPNSLMEAMALGIPCLSTDCPCGGPRMLFGNLLSDRLIECGDEKLLSQQIEKMLTDNVDGRKEKFLAEQFRPEIVFTHWEDYIQKVMKQE